MTDKLGSLDSSRDLQTSSVIIFVISLYLIFQMYKDVLSKILQEATKHGLGLSEPADQVVGGVRAKKKILVISSL